MLIRSFSVQNYKGFRDHQVVELGPLTLLYGENSAGKSALLRLLPWISESMSDPRPGPVLDGIVGREALWSDLVHISSSRHPIEVTIAWAAGNQAGWQFRGGALPGSCELASIHLENPFGAWMLKDDGDGLWRGQVEGVRGLLPVVNGSEHQYAHLNLREFVLDVQWLQGTRASVPRVEKVLATPPSQLSSKGEGVARFLYQWDRQSRTSREARALEYVQSFFRELGLDLRITDVAPAFFRLDVAPLGNPSALVNLVDTGEGLTQVLAPLVAMARALFGLGPRVVCLEQPELHLHTDAQKVLAASIANAAGSGAQILIETHSEVLLAAVQLAIATRTSIISSEDVALYWIAKRRDATSTARRAPLDAHGRLSGAWPLDAFGDLLQLKGELLRAQQRGAW